jgi:methionyl-tRNA synthetase
VDIIKNYHSFNYANIIKFFEDTLDKVNIMISNIKPWALVKTNPEQAQIFCTEILNSFYKISILIKPILPSLVEKIENLFGLGKLNFTHIEKIWSNQNIKYKILLTRIPEYKEEMMSERLAVENQEQKIEQKIEQVKNDVSSIDIKDLQKISLKIAKIINAAEVEGADKLLQLTVDWNEGPKNVFAGIKSSYGPDDLIGKMTVVVTNLKPRKMRFGISEAMVLIANDENGLYLLEPDTNAKPGNKVS